jgi:hypothetical protein
LRRAKDRDNPFVMIDRAVFEDPTISFKAKGLMGYLLSRPDNWEVHLGDLVKRSTDGASAVQTAIVELEAAGYMTRKRVRGDHGQFFSYLVLVHEVPVPEEDRTKPEKRFRPDKAPVGGFPQTDNPVVDNPVAENRVLTNSNCTETDLTDIPPDEPTSLPENRAERRPDMFDLAARTLARTGGKASSTVPADAGGADPWQGEPLAAFAEVVGLHQIPTKQARGWARQIESVSGQWGATPAQAARAIRLMPESEYGWKARSFSTPYSKDFQGVLGVMVDRVVSGGGDGPVPGAPTRGPRYVLPDWVLDAGKVVG